MADVRRFTGRRDDLTRRERIEVELPRFLVRVFEQQVARANENARTDERVTLNDFIEIHLAEFLSIADVATLEREVPGLGEAVWRWLEKINQSDCT